MRAARPNALGRIQKCYILICYPLIYLARMALGKFFRIYAGYEIIIKVLEMKLCLQNPPASL